MVDAITAVSASSATTPTRVESSLSITSEPDNKWVAERQSRIDADQAILKNRGRRPDQDESSGDAADEEPIPLFEGHSHHPGSAHGHHGTPESQTDQALLSGESERIGSTNFDDDTPFGHRVAIV